MVAVLDPAARRHAEVRESPAPDAAPAAAPAAGDETAGRVLFVAPDLELRFVAHDLDILSAVWPVDVVLRRDHPRRRDLLREVRRHLAARRVSLLYIWFAEPYDAPFLILLGRLAGVRTVLVTGGYDITALPEIGYGSLLTRGGRWRVRTALLAADAVLPFSEHSAGEVRRLGRRRGVRTIYPGVDAALFTADGREPAAERLEPPLVLTAATVARGSWRRKGLDIFARASRLLPAARFTIIGRVADAEIGDRLRELGGDNLTLLGRRATTAELGDWYRRAAVYAQLSAHEGFGLALAEAMACGCVPVASAVGSLPEVVGETGILVPPGDAEAAARAIGAALGGGLGNPSLLAAAARRRITSLFPLERRRRELLAAVAALLPAAGQAGAGPPW